MRHNDDLILYRILSGKHRFVLNEEILYITQPTPLHYCLAEELFEDILEQASFEGVLNDSDMLLAMQEIGQWSIEEEVELNNFPKQLEDVKCDMYENFAKVRDIKSHRKVIQELRKRANILSNKRIDILCNTSDSLANAAKVQFLASACVQTAEMKYKWDLSQINDIPYYNIIQIVYAYNSTYFSETILRRIARSNNAWRMIWSSKKSCASLFDVPVVMLTDMQKQLINWSIFYDSIKENPECPNDNVIEDDDLLDGWATIQSRERTQEKASKQGDGNFANKKISNAQEVFYVVGDDVERAKRIAEMNNPEGRLAKRRKSQLVTQHGQISEEKLPESQLQMKMQAVEAYRNKVKGITHGK